ncbi:MAG: FG-GAP-like repeat-containing protein, partial [Calditrichaceae bacterium]
EKIWTESFIDSAISQGVCAGDLDGDGDPDIYVANWFRSDYLLINDGTGMFTPLRTDLPTLTQPISTNSAAFADVDNDGDPDLFVATRDGFVFYYRNESKPGEISFVNVTSHPFYSIGQSVYGLLFEDFNHDGWLDCFLTIKGINRLYLGDGQGGFLAGYDADTRHTYSTGSAAADLDGDGDLDIFVSNKDEFSQVYLNPTNKKNFISLRLTGVRSNRDAIGAKVYFYTGNDSLRKLIGFREVSANKGYLSSSDPVVFFGTGKNAVVNAEILFPSGKRIMLTGLEPGQNYAVSEYGQLIGGLYFGWYGLKYRAGQSAFWISLILFFLLSALLYGYVTLGLRRYQWTAFSISMQLTVWFIVSLIVFIVFSQRVMTDALLTLNGLTVFAGIVAVMYSEHLIKIRRRRTRFRLLLQGLSDQMIEIHRNEDLYKKLIDTVVQHDEIEKAAFFCNGPVDMKPGYVPPNLDLSENATLRLNVKEKEQLIHEKILNRGRTEIDLTPANADFNVLIPVKRNQLLYGLIALEMNHSESPLNQQDLQLISTICNQAAITIENNNYIEETAELVKKLTTAQLKEQYVTALEKTNRELDEKNNELQKLFRELQQKEAQLIHSEKMASLGQLVAGISHELNNPISFIYANMNILNGYMDELTKILTGLNLPPEHAVLSQFSAILDDLRNIINDSQNGSRTVKELVQNLKNFSRLDQAEWKEARVVSGLESSLKILRHQIPDSIEIKKEFHDDPIFLCNPGQLNQVFLNLISNALQSMKGTGSIYLRTHSDDEFMTVEIEDSGSGIPSEVLPKIFDPFFTTKDVNKGTGLGLSISYSIIQHHKGTIEVESQIGKGTKFIIRLPLSGATGEKK